LLDSPQFLKLHEYVDFPVYTKSSNLPPHHIGKKCLIHNCMISDGCLILGDIYHSILSSNVVVENGSLIKDSILLQHVHVEEGVNISKAFILESTRIPAFTELVFDEITIIDAEYIAKLGDSHE